ncbi:MAG: tRNA-(ms[2]io[6]A)-hydroxylase [Flavobacteriaceae bacterium]|jgi:tRNA-(ms[2]io[6]A)-hydroxylase|nr:tRNA-(ms[2]io[6]A)-hydroxylase [Flavobacteriaceae bacterium]
MLGLKLPTDPRWVNIVEKNVAEILTDHAYCEQKAANSAISLIIGYPKNSELVSAMIDLAQEEISHFKMVHELILARGYVLGRERKDDYVRKLQNFFPKGGSRETHLVHKLLVAGLIEARSCERFRLLSEELDDAELRKFYRKLMISEANHYTLFLKLAHQYAPKEIDVETKWQQLLAFEAELMKELGNKETVHG